MSPARAGSSLGIIASLISFYLCRVPPHSRKRQIVSRLLGCFPSMLLRSRYGVLLRSDAKDLTNMFSLVGEYDDVFEVVTELRPGMAFIDIGANAGVFSMVAGQRVGEKGLVIAFEPSAATFTKLAENAAANGLRNFAPFMAAVGTSTGVKRLRTNERHTGAAYLDPDGNTQVVQLDGSVLAGLLAKFVGDRKIMIKIDVEGAEFDVIQAIGDLLGSQSTETVIVEMNDGQLSRFGATSRAIYDAMQEKGYKPRFGIGFSRHYNEIFSHESTRPSRSYGAARPAQDGRGR